jgi:hypothetical protein
VDKNSASSKEMLTPDETFVSPEMLIDRKSRFYIIGAALLALFLSALDTLVMGAAIPTIVADLGGLHLFHGLSSHSCNIPADFWQAL